MIRKLAEDFSREEHEKRAMTSFYTPHIGKSKLWETSGHLDWYADAMYPPVEVEEQKYYLKPMNCPFHIQIYKSKTRSYRDLPVRYAEWGTVYRYERSGTLHGLLRVRGLTQDDAHLFCRPDQMRMRSTRRWISACISCELSDSTTSTPIWRPAIPIRRPARRSSGKRQPKPSELRSSGRACSTRWKKPKPHFTVRRSTSKSTTRFTGSGSFPRSSSTFPAGALWAVVRGRGRSRASALHDPSRADGSDGALLRNAHRAPCGRLPSLAGAGPGQPDSDRRPPSRLCARGGRAAEGSWITGRGGRAEVSG